MPKINVSQGETPVLPLPQNKTYSCLVIDPPWQYNLRPKDATHRNKIPYQPMAMNEILALPIPELCEEKGAIIWLWFTNNHPAEAIDCVRHWGLNQKTILTWEKTTKEGFKTKLSVGHWLRGGTEHCLLCTRGKVNSFAHQKLLTNQTSIIREAPREHSRKPEKFYQLVEHFCRGSKLELFARQRRPGWHSWGDQVDLFGGTNGS